MTPGGLLQRPRRLFPRPLHRHRHPADHQLPLRRPGDGGDAASRPSSRGRSGFENTPRALITDFDTTKRSNVNVDYNHYFNGLGCHSLRAGYGFQHVLNDINSYYPGGYVDLLFGRSFTFNGVTTGTGTYGYYDVNDRRITNQAGSDIQSLYVQDQWMLGNRLTLNLGHPHRGREHPDFRPGSQRRLGDQVQHEGQARAAARRGLRRLRRRPHEGVRQLGPLLRLDQVRAAARLVRRRDLVHLLSRPRHARLRQPQPEQHARAAISGSRRAPAATAASRRSKSIPTSSR